MNDPILKATRESYGEILTELGAENDRIVVFDADLSGSTKTALFAKQFPDRFFNCGIAESNMISLAAGAAAAGMISFASTFAMFAAGRAFEQVRNSIGYPGLNVKIGATHAGLSVGEDGATHQCNEDIALMRTIPGMTVLCPADDLSAKALVRQAAERTGPVYMRFSRFPTPLVYPDAYAGSFTIGQATTCMEGSDLTIVAIGLMLHRALEAARILAEQGIHARVLDMHTVKPIDKNAIIKAASETGAIVTAEEHSVIGGLGSAVAEIVSGAFPVPVLRVGVNDTFGESGIAFSVLQKYGLTADNIVKYTMQALAMKSSS